MRNARESWTVTRRTFLQTAAAAALAGAGKAAAPLRFGVVTDIHYADREPSGTRFYRMGIPKLRACVDLMNSERVDFMIELGDFKDAAPQPSEESTLAFLRDIETVFAGFRGPRYHVLGNHDEDSITKEQFQSAVTNTGIDPARTWYSFDRGGLHFIVLDGNFRKDMAPYSKGNFQWGDTNISPPQIEWLAGDLHGSKGPAIVFVHQRLDEGESEPSIANRVQVRKLLEESGRVGLVLQGHVHRGAYNRTNGIHYCTLPGSIEGGDPGDNTCAIVTADPARGAIEIAGYRRTVSRKLEG
jgi:alkaline phosphatase